MAFFVHRRQPKIISFDDFYIIVYGGVYSRDVSEEVFEERLTNWPVKKSKQFLSFVQKIINHNDVHSFKVNNNRFEEFPCLFKFNIDIVIKNNHINIYNWQTYSKYLINVFFVSTNTFLNPCGYRGRIRPSETSAKKHQTSSQSAQTETNLKNFLLQNQIVLKAQNLTAIWMELRYEVNVYAFNKWTIRSNAVPIDNSHNFNAKRFTPVS